MSRSHTNTVQMPKISCQCSAIRCDNIVKVFLSEAFATAILLFVGCSGMWFMPITFGVGIAIATQVFGDISGAHINPVVTLAAVIMGRIDSILLVPIYLVAQFLGALVGCGLHYMITVDHTILDSFCVLKRPPGELVLSDDGNVFGFELLMSFIYILALCALWEQHDRTEGNSSLPLKRGIFYTGIVMCWFWGFGMPLSLNPMRALVPIIVTPTHNNYNNNNDLPIDTPSVWDDQWIYWVAPILGSLIACVFYKLMRFLQQRTKRYE